MRASSTTGALLAVAIAMSACGGSDESDVRSTVVSYFHALATYDGATACAKLSREARSPFDAAGRGRGKCAGVMTLETRQQISGADKSHLTNVNVTTVKVTGESAVATVKVPGKTATVPLIKEGGQWRISAAQSG